MRTGQQTLKAARITILNLDTDQTPLYLSNCLPLQPSTFPTVYLSDCQPLQLSTSQLDLMTGSSSEYAALIMLSWGRVGQVTWQYTHLCAAVPNGSIQKLSVCDPIHLEPIRNTLAK